MLGDVFFVDAQHVRRRRGVGLHVIVEFEAVDVAEVSPFTDAQDDGLQEAIEASEHLLRRGFAEIPRPDRVLDGLKQRVLADTLGAAEDEGVIYFLMWALHPVRKPRDDMVCVITENPVDVIDPPIGLRRVAMFDRRRPIEIKTAHSGPLDPSAFSYQVVRDQHGQTRCPSHLLHGLVAIEPGVGRHRLSVADRDWWYAGVDAARRPHLARWRENVGVRRHVGVEVFKGHADIRHTRRG